MPVIGPTEIILIAGVALLLFGKRVPSVMRSLGKGIVEFKKGVHGIEDEIEEAVQNADTAPSPAQAKEDKKESDDASDELGG